MPRHSSSSSSSPRLYVTAPLLALLATSPLLATALDNGLSKVPAMGWNTWNAYGCDIDESVVLANAKALVDEGFTDFGYEYLNIDDCWQADERTANGTLEANAEKFPNGLASVVDKIHGYNLKAGIYSSAGTLTCGGHIASLDMEETDAKSWAEAGFDYVKYDNCFNQGRAGNQKLSYDRYNAMSQALNKTGRPMLYSGCNWGEDQPWLFGSTIFNSWRISGDITNSFNREDDRCPCESMVNGACNTQGFHCSVERILDFAAPLGQKSGPGYWNDLDMLEVGNPEGEGMTRDEYITHFTMWSLVKSPLIMGNVLENISAEHKAILTNEHVIAINQDRGSTAAIRVRKDKVSEDNGGGSHQVWYSTLSNGSYALAAINFGSEKWAYTPNLAKDLFFDNKTAAALTFHAYDLWDGVNYTKPAKKGERKLKPVSGGPFKGKLPKTTIRPHQTKVWTLVPTKEE